MGQQSAILDRLLVLNEEMVAALKQADIDAGNEPAIDMRAYRTMPRNVRNAQQANIFAEIGPYDEERVSVGLVALRQVRLVALVRQVQLDRQVDDDHSLAYEEVDRFLDFAEDYIDQRRRLETSALAALGFIAENITFSHGGAVILSSVNRMSYVGAVITLTIPTYKKVK